MPRLSLSWSLLILFTSPDRAESIEGDLREEARTRGSIWFWTHVIRTAAALWWKGFRDSTLELLGLTLCCGVVWLLMFVLGFVVRAGVEGAAESLGVTLSIRALVPALLSTFLAGIVWIRIAPVRGMHASVALALATFPTLTTMFLVGRPIEGIDDVLVQFAAGSLTVAPLVLGSALARRRFAGRTAGAV